MLYDNTVESLETEALAVLSFRRSVEVVLISLLASFGAVALELPARLPEKAQVVVPFVLGAMALIALLFGGLLGFLWRSPPAGLVQGHASAITAKRQANKPVRMLSRAALFPLSGVAFGAAYWLLGRVAF